MILHAIIGQSCYVKFVAIPNYIYIKLKNVEVANGVMNVSSSF